MCRALRRAGRGVLKGARAALKGGELEAAARLLRAGGGGSATLESGEEAAARLWRVGSWRRQRGYGGRGVGGGSAAMEGGE